MANKNVFEWLTVDLFRHFVNLLDCLSDVELLSAAFVQQVVEAKQPLRSFRITKGLGGQSCLMVAGRGAVNYKVGPVDLRSKVRMFVGGFQDYELEDDEEAVQISTLEALGKLGVTGGTAEAIKLVQKYDADGDGYFSKDEVVRIVRDLRSTSTANAALEASNALYKKIIWALAFFCFLQIGRAHV